MDLKVGQTYIIKIKEPSITSDSKNSAYVKRKAKLIFKSEKFLTFEYKSKSGDFLRETIDCFELKSNPNLILEA